MRISMIVAAGRNGAIGKNNDLLWFLPRDMKHFRLLTTGHTVLMGSNTFRSLPKGPLPNRRNLVLTSKMLPGKGYDCVRSLTEAVSKAEATAETELFIIGGAKVYESLLPYVERLYLTRVEAAFPNADTFFPSIDMEQWIERERVFWPKDDKNIHDAAMCIYDKIQGVSPLSSTVNTITK